MHGPHIEQQFQHFAFEHEQLQRKMATRRLYETAHPRQEHPRRSLVDLFGRFVDRLDPRVPNRRSTVTFS